MTIHLRPIEDEHLPALRDWRNNEESHSTFREYRLLNMTNQRDWLNRVSRDSTVEMFSIQFIDILVGMCGLCYINWVNRTAEVSIFVAHTRGKPRQGVSVRDLYAEETLVLLQDKAFEEFNLRRLWVEIYEFDLAKIAWFEKAGYALEGRLRKHVFKLGKYHDSLMYGLLKC